MNIKLASFVRDYKIALLILCAVLMLFAWRSDFVQKHVNATDYWAAKVKKSREMVTFYRNELKVCRLELLKLLRNQEIEVKQRMLEGKSGQEAREDYLYEFEVGKEICSVFENGLEIEMQELKENERQLETASVK